MDISIRADMTVAVADDVFAFFFYDLRLTQLIYLSLLY